MESSTGRWGESEEKSMKMARPRERARLSARCPGKGSMVLQEC